MSKTFICIHCGESVLLNVRLKGKQSYCGKKGCQQARKNAWEREKLKDADYRKKRSAQKFRWRKSKPIYKYQKRYRSLHPDYEKKNREQQANRNKRRTNLSNTDTTQKIVNTDTLPAGFLLSKSLYILTPCSANSAREIVNTDTYIVKLQAWWPKEGFCLTNGT